MGDTLDTMLLSVTASPWALLAVAVAAGLDAIVPLSPSEATVFAVAIASTVTGEPPLGLIIIAAAVGAYGGDLLSYFIGRRTGRRLVGRLGWSHRTRGAYDWVHRAVHHRGGRLIVLVRYLPGGRSASTLAAGAVGYPLGRFRLYTAVGVSLWASQATLLGYFSGSLFHDQPARGLLLGCFVSAAVALVLEAASRGWLGTSRSQAAGG